MNGGGAEHLPSEGWSFPCLFCGTQVTRVRMSDQNELSSNFFLGGVEVIGATSRKFPKKILQNMLLHVVQIIHAPSHNLYVRAVTLSSTLLTVWPVWYCTFCSHRKGEIAALRTHMYIKRGCPVLDTWIDHPKKRRGLYATIPFLWLRKAKKSLFLGPAATERLDDRPNEWCLRQQITSCF